MDIVHSIANLRQQINQARQQNQRIGFVPTMGNLHAGHISLIEQARQTADFVVCSIFVNPTQFGAGEDFATYPKTLDEDADKLQAAHCDLIFAPDVDDVYPQQSHDWIKVEVTDITRHHCGASRQGHFAGVALVVSKLFNMVQPDIAVFGKKDYQQLAVIRRLVTALNFPIRIIGGETVREANGLAMSSRNGYLSAEEKAQAAAIYQQLKHLKAQIQQGDKDFATLTNAATSSLQNQQITTEYLNIAAQESLEPADADTQDLVILFAGRLGSTRLIDNIDFSLASDA